MNLYFLKCQECNTEFFIKCDDFDYPSGKVQLNCPCGAYIEEQDNE